MAPLLNRVVFAGDTALDCLITDPAIAALHRPMPARSPMPIVAYGSPDRITGELRNLGFVTDPASPMADHWRIDDGPPFTLIAPEGWSPIANPWYAYVLECTIPMQAANGLVYRIVGAPAFIAVALQPLTAGAGHTDLFTANGVWEDVVLLARGRATLAREVLSAPSDVRDFIAGALHTIASSPDALMLVHDLLPRAARSSLAAQRTLQTLRDITRVVPRAETAPSLPAYISGPVSPNPLP
jgi:hypothetical protein